MMRNNTQQTKMTLSHPSNRYRHILLIVFLLMLSAPLLVQAAGETAVFTVDSQIFESGGSPQTMDAKPFIKDGRTLVPVRYLATALGVLEKDILWSPERQEVTLVKDTTTVLLTIGKMDYQLGGKSAKMDVAPLILNGRTYLPARYVAEAFGFTVGWNPTSRSVLVTAETKSEPKTHAISITGFKYMPATLTIKAGDTVIWTNQDSAKHTVTGGVLDSPLFGEGETFTYTFKTAGTYNYICTPHPSMKGSVIVE